MSLTCIGLKNNIFKFASFEGHCFEIVCEFTICGMQS